MIDILTVFLLGLGVIIHPCTIAPNIAALTFISHRDGHAGLALAMYILGHTLAYIVLGCLLVVLARQTNALSSLQNESSFGHYILMAVFLLAGIWLIWTSFREHHHHEMKHSVLSTPMGAFFSGVGIAYLFCPEAAFVFFGMVIPTAITSSVEMLVPISFAIGTMLPLIALAWALITGKEQFMPKLNISRQIINRALGVIFLIAALVMFLF